MATNTQAPLTYQEYFDLPESDDRYELIDGELYMAPTPIPEHQDFLAELFTMIRTFVRENSLGRAYIAPLAVALSEYVVLQPDMMFISNERLGIIKWGQYVQGAPDLVVEVLSPSTTRHDRVVKRELYARYGVREYWIADINHGTIEVDISGGESFITAGVYGEGDTFESTLLPGLEVDISAVFESARI